MENFDDIFDDTFFRDMRNSPGAALILYDCQQNICRYTSPTMYQLTGNDPSALVDFGIEYMNSVGKDGFYHEQNTFSMEILFSGTTNSIYPYSFDNLRRFVSEDQVWIEMNFYILTFTEDHLPHLFMNVMKNISYRKKAELFLIQELFNREPSETNRKRLEEKYDQHMKPYSLNFNEHLLVGEQVKEQGNRFLSLREREVVQLISKGVSTKEIAERLCLSFHTIQSHRKNILKKLGVKNSAELIRQTYLSNWNI